MILPGWPRQVVKLAAGRGSELAQAPWAAASLAHVAHPLRLAAAAHAALAPLPGRRRQPPVMLLQVGSGSAVFSLCLRNGPLTQQL